MRKNTAIELDITKNIENGVKFYAKQFDDIKLKVKVFDGVREVDVEGQDVIVCIVKEDKTVIEQRKDITVEDNTLIIDLTKQATTALGKCQMEILLRDEEGTTSTSTVSYVVGEKLSATIVEIIQSEDDIEALNMIEEFIQNSNIDIMEIKEAVKELKEAVEEAQGTIDADLEAIISKIEELEATTLENIETAAGTIKEETILTITNKADEVLEEMESIKGEVIGNVNEAIEKADEAVLKATETLETVNTVKEEVEKINDVIAEAMENIETTKDEAMDEIAGAVVVIEESKEDAVNVVSNAKNMAVSSVVDEKDKSITEIGTVKTGAVNTVNEAGVNGVNAVDTTRARAIGEIEGLKDNSTNAIEGLKVSAVEEIREAKTDALKQLQNNGNGIADALTTLKGELVSGISLEAEAIKDVAVEGIGVAAGTIKEEAISNINTVKTGAIEEVEAVKDGAVSSINAVKDNVLEDITTAKEEAVSAIADTKTDAIEKVNEACGVADAKIAEILRELEAMVSEKEDLLNTNALAGETKEELKALIEEAKRYEQVVRAWIDAQANVDLTEITEAIEELRVRINKVDSDIKELKTEKTGFIGDVVSTIFEKIDENTKALLETVPLPDFEIKNVLIYKDGSDNIHVAMFKDEVTKGKMKLYTSSSKLQFIYTSISSANIKMYAYVSGEWQERAVSSYWNSASIDYKAVSGFYYHDFEFYDYSNAEKVVRKSSLDAGENDRNDFNLAIDVKTYEVDIPSDSTTILNAPMQGELKGVLEVIKVKEKIIQRLTTIESDVYIRTCNYSEWTEWDKIDGDVKTGANIEVYKGMIGEDPHPECFRTAPLMTEDETHYVRCLSVNNKYRVYYLKNAPALNHYNTAGGCEMWYTDTVTKSRVFEYNKASKTWGEVNDTYIRIYASGGGIVVNTYSSNVDLYNKAGSEIMVPAKPGDPLTAPINTFNVEEAGEYLVSHTSLLTGSYKDAFEGSLVVRNINGNIYQDLISSDCRERVVRSKVKGVWTDWLVANADLYYTKEEVDAKLNEIKAMIGQ